MRLAAMMNSESADFPEKNACGALRGVDQDSKWDAIFASLRKDLLGRVAARSDENSPELRERLSRFARGECAPAEIEDLCRSVSCSPDELAALAAMMKANEECE